MKNKIITLGVAALLLSLNNSCKNTEATSSAQPIENSEMTANKDGSSATTSAEDENMIEGTIVLSEVEGDCACTIKTKDGRTFDPVNLDQSLQKDGMKIKFSFTGLRMPNRCTTANPIRIETVTPM
ncbi:MAG: hypothetical protein ABNH00_05135 [Dokdonia sp.]|jgi:hypothetical protein|nr:hypothetical protein [Cytophagaceae bacterium]|tara:strand:- start:509 stop:886 length:378 start_codon:yes stop_codon:yes gene_type:complete